LSQFALRKDLSSDFLADEDGLDMDREEGESISPNLDLVIGHSKSKLNIEHSKYTIEHSNHNTDHHEVEHLNPDIEHSKPEIESTNHEVEHNKLEIENSEHEVEQYKSETEIEDTKHEVEPSKLEIGSSYDSLEWTRKPSRATHLFLTADPNFPRTLFVMAIVQVRIIF
jgi:hypothetical protein